MTGKHAYLIMAHHRFDVLKMLLTDLDYKDNDIYLHIDKKTKNAPIEDLKKCVHVSRLVFIDRIPVYWGHSSQTQCVLNLLKAATDSFAYDYYHLLVGVEFPLMTQDQIHRFFEENNGKEFIGYVNGQGYEERIKYYYFWWKYYRGGNTLPKKTLFFIGRQLLKLQKVIGVNRLTHENNYYKKGYANWSITDALARYIVKNEAKIKHAYRFTFLADEVFFHTLVYHSPFKNNIYDLNDEYHSVMRLTTWTDPRNQFHYKDIPMLLESGRLFARKFDDETATETIAKIIELREQAADDNTLQFKWCKEYVATM